MKLRILFIEEHFRIGDNHRKYFTKKNSYSRHDRLAWRIEASRAGKLIIN